MERLPRALRLGLALSLTVLVACLLLRAVQTGHEQLLAPFSLGPSEFSNLETIQVIRSGANPYAPEVYAAPPLVLTVYTPLYHYLVALAPMPDADPFFWGRVVAAAAMLAAGLLPLLAGGRSVWAFACIAAGIFLALKPVVLRTAFLRSDSLGVLLAALAVCCLHRGRGRTAGLAGALAFSLLALFTRQSLVAAPLACTIHLWLSDRRAFRRFTIAGVTTCLAVLVAIQLGWGGGFWFSIIHGTGQPMLLQQGLGVVKRLLSEPLLIGVVAACLLLAGGDVQRRGRAAWSESPYPIYALLSLLIAVATVGKVGSGTNYFIEPLLALLLWASHAASVSPPEPRRRALLATGIVIAGVLELTLIPRPVHRWAPPARARAIQQELELHRAKIESLGFEHPSVLGLADHPGLYRESDDVQLGFPDLYYWLWETGSLDIDETADRIARHEFDVVVVPESWIADMPPSRLLWGQQAVAMDGPRRLVAIVRERYRVGASRGNTLYFVPD